MAINESALPTVTISPIEVSSLKLSTTQQVAIASRSGLLRHVDPRLPKGDTTPKRQEDMCFACEMQNIDEFASLPFIKQRNILEKSVITFQKKVQERQHSRVYGSTLIFALLMGERFLVSCTGDSAAFCHFASSRKS